jgi:hypothetical protein
MGNFFINGLDLYLDVMKDPERFLWKIVSASALAGKDVANDMKEAVSDIVASERYDDVSEVCERLLGMLEAAIGVQKYVEKEK